MLSKMNYTGQAKAPSRKKSGKSIEKTGNGKSRFWVMAKRAEIRK